MTKGSYKERTIVCVSCGKTHTAKMKAGRKYCSSECRYSGPRPSRRTGKDVACGNCNKEIYRNARQLEQASTHFCSVTCANVFQSKDKLKFVCKTCNSDFFWSKSRIKEHNPTYCSMECRNNDPEWIRNACIGGNLVQMTKKGLNKLELIGRAILKECDVDFMEQVLIADKFLVDVLIPSHNIVIQWDGDYWHGHSSKLKNGIPDRRQTKRMNLDKSQDAYMKKCGYRVLRFWEHEVLSESSGNDYIKTRIQEALATKSQQPQETDVDITKFFG